jgi:hypothetical protein
MLKRYQILIPLSILVVILVAACSGTPAAIPQTGATSGNQPTQPATTVQDQATGAVPQSTETTQQAAGSTQAGTVEPQATTAATQSADGTQSATAASPSTTETAPATGNTTGIPATGQTTGNKPEASVGQLPNAQPAEMQPFIGAAKDLPQNLQDAVANYLVRMLNADPAKVLIVSAVKRDFNNACLGLATEGESCAETVTPGWLAIGIVNGSYYVVHASEDGTNLRLETPLDNAGLTNFGRDFPIQGGTGQ